MQNIIAIENGVTRHPLYRMKEPVNMTLAAGEHIAVVGRNGAGKSILVDTITGRWPLLMNEVKYDFSPSPSKMAYENIKYIAFRDSYGDADGNYYYQQRWNAHDLDETPLVRDLLPEATDSGLEKALYELFGMERMLDKHIILLSVIHTEMPMEITIISNGGMLMIWMKLHWYVICCPKRPIQAWKRLCMNCLAWRGCWINISFCFPVVSYVSFN